MCGLRLKRERRIGVGVIHKAIGERTSVGAWDCFCGYSDFYRSVVDEHVRESNQAEFNRAAVELAECYAGISLANEVLALAEAIGVKP